VDYAAALQQLCTETRLAEWLYPFGTCSLGTEFFSLKNKVSEVARAQTRAACMCYVACGPNHTLEKGIGRPGRYGPKNAAENHSFVVNHGEVYKQTTKG
jgi:hypothetical protein